MQKLPVTDADSVTFTKIVRKINFFASMNMGLLEKILAWISLYQYKKGEKICRQGDIGDAFYVVAEGKLSINIKKGLLSFSKQIATLGPGDCFGEMSLLRRTPRTATVICEEDTKVFVLLADHFDAAIKDNPSFAQQIKRLASERQFELNQK